MNTFLATVLVFFAILGHGYLWVAIVNRLHGWNGPRKLIDGLTLLSCVGFILLPVGVGWYWWKLRGHYLTQHESHSHGRLQQYA